MLHLAATQIRTAQELRGESRVASRHLAWTLALLGPNAWWSQLRTALNSCLWVQRWSGRLSVDDFGKIRRARGTCLATRTRHTCSLAPGSWCCLEHAPRSIVMRVPGAARQRPRGASREALCRHLFSRRHSSARRAMLPASLARQKHGHAAMHRRVQCHGHDGTAAPEECAGAEDAEGARAQAADQQARPKRLQGAPMIHR